MIGEALEQHLSSDATVNALVGARIYPGIAPDVATYPLIQYIQAGSQRLPSLDPAHGDKGPLLQIDIYAQRGGGIADSVAHVRLAKDIAAAVETAMESFRGVYGDIEVKGCHLEGERELPDSDGLARMSQDYQVWWRNNA